MPAAAVHPPVPFALPAGALAELRSGTRPFGVYVHVPWCASRCGYCDFNTYVPDRVRGAAPAAFAATAAAEAALMARALDGAAPPASTVFFGGGTPTLLAAADLAAVLDAIRAAVGLAADAEVTVEANPETVDPAKLEAMRAAGVTRVSLGMQSAAPSRARAISAASAAAVAANAAGAAPRTRSGT